MRAVAFAAAAALLVPAAAIAQPAPAAPNQGPMIIERVQSGFLVAPDIKVTEFDKRTEGLAGGYAGWITDNALFIGGGGYWLADNSRNRGMGYGGLVVQWLSGANDRIGWTAKGLIGGGEATLPVTVTETIRVPVDPRNVDPRNQRFTTTTQTINTRFREGFFVAEPEAGVLLRVARHVRITAGAGYRFVGAEHRDDGRLRGATGSLGVQIGGGS